MTLRYLSVTVDEWTRKFVASTAGFLFFLIIAAAVVWVMGYVSEWGR